MRRAIRFAVAYALYASAVLGYTYYLLAQLAESHFSLSSTALAAVTAASLILPILDVIGWRVLSDPKRAGRAATLVVLVGVTIEASASENLLDLVGVALKYSIHLVVLLAAAALYSLAYARPGSKAPLRVTAILRQWRPSHFLRLWPCFLLMYTWR